MTQLNAHNLSVSYEKRRIIQELNVTLPEGKIIGLIGPNGSGKSTFLKALARILTPEAGQIWLDDQLIEKYPSKEVAKKIAMLAQGSVANLALSVKEVVSYGRYPYVKGFRQLSLADHQQIEWALQATGLTKLADRNINALSGGQRQRVWIAMALAQDTEILILDEPTTYLDPAHQLEVLNLLEEINQKNHKTILMSIHDLNLASRFCDYLYGMKDGHLILEGSPNEVLTKEGMAQLFGIDAEIVQLPSGKPVILTYEIQAEVGEV
ncbi:ABC transporter ATP-binding protein [Enterococcus asini]|uniref:ABC transporter ATP-binding protein n=1 Tax=Enterococcus asini TaxID=57732 RepID=UPI00288F78B3|nr:ABC transporter ATP-binding protein [Enterococcus asini]MDT2756767.1 ABC transporter ATP-binding protein [Enterococcus asini]